jgi:uncharacterized membrane protein
MELTEILKVLGIAVLPISELRGAIPVAIVTYDFPWYYAYLFGVIGSLLPVPFILLFLNGIIPVFNRVPFLNRMMQWFFERTRHRSKMVERYKWLGLTLFVSIPLPITGAWTGSILAVLLGLKFRQSLFPILVGVIIAGAIVTCATVLGWAIADLFTA